MGRLKEMVQWRIVSGAAVSVGDVTVTPQSRTLILRWPHGGLIWNRPAAVLVQRGEGTERIPIVDVTLIAQSVLLALALLAAIGTVLFSIRAKEKRNPRRNENG